MESSFHRDEEARRELGAGGARVEQRGGRVSHPTLREHVVGVDGALDILVDADGDAHQQVLGALDDLAVDAEQVRALQGLVPEVVVVEVTIVHDLGVEAGGILRIGFASHVVGQQGGPLGPLRSFTCSYI